MTNNLRMAFACSVVPNLVTDDCRTGSVFFLRLVRDNLMLVVGAAGRVPAASFFLRLFRDNFRPQIRSIFLGQVSLF